MHLTKFKSSFTTTIKWVFESTIESFFVWHVLDNILCYNGCGVEPCLLDLHNHCSAQSLEYFYVFLHKDELGVCSTFQTQVKMDSMY